MKIGFQLFTGICALSHGYDYNGNDYGRPTFYRQNEQFSDLERANANNQIFVTNPQNDEPIRVLRDAKVYLIKSGKNSPWTNKKNYNGERPVMRRSFSVPNFENEKRFRDRKYSTDEYNHYNQWTPRYRYGQQSPRYNQHFNRYFDQESRNFRDRHGDYQANNYWQDKQRNGQRNWQDFEDSNDFQRFTSDRINNWNRRFEEAQRMNFRDERPMNRFDSRYWQPNDKFDRRFTNNRDNSYYYRQNQRDIDHDWKLNRFYQDMPSENRQNKFYLNDNFEDFDTAKNYYYRPSMTNTFRNYNQFNEKYHSSTPFRRDFQFDDRENTMEEENYNYFPVSAWFIDSKNEDRFNNEKPLTIISPVDILFVKSS